MGAEATADFTRWEQAIEAANMAFERNDDTLARVLYDKTIALAQHLLASKPWREAGDDADDRAEVFDSAVAAFVVSHHNAANLHKRSGTCDDVTALYRRAHLTVSDLTVAPDLEEPLRAIAQRHITRTLGELAFHLQSSALFVPDADCLASGRVQ